ncbi:MAG TPA: VOC family protein [Jatrophihabitans sp.]|nr:VOC family protein [Jatrophihabitans sp.]
MLDHVVLAAPDLGRAVAQFADRTGLVPAPGGSHPGLGTANYLVALGPNAYLELIGPDPDQPRPAPDRPFLVDRLPAPRIVTWAIRTADIDAAVTDARRRGYDPGAPRAMSRATPTGEVLRWRLTPPRPEVDDGLVPFLIDWGATAHPAGRRLPSVGLVGLRATHPDPDAIQPRLRALDAALPVDAGPRAALILTIETPRGVQVLS